MAGNPTTIDTMLRLIAIIHLLLLFCLLASAPDALAASRGIAVNLKGSDNKDAEVVGSVELYQESYALVIGIDGYSNGWPQLSNAIKDAELIAALLEEKGFDVELHKDLDADQLDRVFKEFFIIKGSNASARLFVWFAGHGATVDGEGFLIPADAPVPNAGPQFKLRSVALRDFGTYMRLALSKHVYSVFDSCFAGTVFSSQRALPPAAITHATTLPVRQFLTSGDAAQTVSDDGTFRELFIRAVQGEERSDANGDGYVTASELGMFLNDRITNLTSSAQTPRYGKLRDKDFDRGDFVFVLPENAQVTAAPLASQDNSVEIAFWNSIEDGGNPEEFDAYLKSYPLGKFASLARLKLTQLRSATPRPRETFRVTLLDEDLEATRIANVRQTPFPSSPKVGRLQKGDVVWGVGVTQTRGGRWYEVARDGVELGFVYGPLLSPIESDDQLLAVAALDPASVVLPTPAAPEVEEAPPPIVEQEVVETDGIPDTAGEILEEMVDDLLIDPVVPRNPAAFVGEGETQIAMITPGTTAGQGSGAPSGQRGIPAQPATQPAPVAPGSAPRNPLDQPQPAAESPVTPAVATQALVAVAAPPASATVQVSAPAQLNPVPSRSNPDPYSAAQVPDSTPAPDSPAASERVMETAPTAASEGNDAAPGGVADPAAETTVALHNTTSAGLTAVPSTAVPSTRVPSASSHSAGVGEIPTENSAEASANVPAGHGDARASDTASAVIATSKPAATQESAGTQASAPDLATGQLQDDATAPPPVGEPRPGNTEPVATTQTTIATAPAVPERRAGVSDFVRRYIDAANGGNTQAQLSLGVMYETGQNVELDIVEAVRWYRTAARNGEVDAQLSLGLLYQKGDALKADPVEAVRWFRLAADQGHADAQQTLGYFYESGTGVVADIAEAARWYERAANQGRVAAQNNLGRLYQLGSGVPKDLDKAIYWYEKAAAQGSETAQRNLRGLLPQ